MQMKIVEHTTSNQLSYMSCVVTQASRDESDPGRGVQEA
jgi:hypothetical protein